mmetsp:Transcript_8857/g.25942  ORF Transcript_8857/g.25942 Transcript_8857/m.25942 type:complete len:294 (+) Transcript_8857:3354-4235(+)
MMSLSITILKVCLVSGHQWISSPRMVATGLPVSSAQQPSYRFGSPSSSNSSNEIISSSSSFSPRLAKSSAAVGISSTSRSSEQIADREGGARVSSWNPEPTAGPPETAAWSRLSWCSAEGTCPGASSTTLAACAGSATAGSGSAGPSRTAGTPEATGTSHGAPGESPAITAAGGLSSSAATLRTSSELASEQLPSPSSDECSSAKAPGIGLLSSPTGKQTSGGTSASTAAVPGTSVPDQSDSPPSAAAGPAALSAGFIYSCADIRTPPKPWRRRAQALGDVTHITIKQTTPPG